MKNILLLIVCLFSVENMYANKFFDDISKALKKKKVVISPMVKHIDYAHEAIPSKKINQNQLNKFFDKYGEYVDYELITFNGNPDNITSYFILNSI